MANFRGGESLPPVVKNLLIVNGLVFLAQILFGKQGIYLEQWGALWSINSGNFRIWQLITHVFMHQWVDQAGNIYLFHILFNMLGLWMFGKILENFWGSKKFLQFYIICGVVAGLAQLLIPSDFGYAVGASGAVMGIFAAFAYLFPNTELYLMFIPIPVKAKWVVGGLIAMDLFGGISGSAGDNIAHWAHLGGALAGVVLVMIWNKTNRRNFY